MQINMTADLNNISSPRIWVLIDNRTGNANQALALASKIGFEYQVKKVRYNILVMLPNFLLGLWPIHVKKSLLDSLKNEDAPDIIISSGRRTASLAVYLKKIYKNKTKLIQIMRPSLNPKGFDLIILPQHDNYRYILPNIVRIIGALNDVQKSIIESKDLLKNNYPELKKFIAVIIGGSTKKYKFRLEDAELLSDIICFISDNHSIPLFVTFSRRTPEKVKSIFKKKLLSSNIFYDPKENLPNPYPAIIGEAEYIITTADSISMCSEAASTGKSIYVFCPENFQLKKHRFFIQQLVDLGIVRILDHNINFLDKYHYEPLREIDKVVEIVKKDFLIKR